ncbi:protein MALE DISCOVERER 2-like [Rutidosis leptorrhynchoides]|uniref:protein MALE DISCOVERER 2-like n=1 Tax=Rutidosis leptorrhynchoides TaxID=125765 RepID=UPI003A99F66A
MVTITMGVRWTTYKIQYSCFPILILLLAHGCSSLNLEGAALLDFKERISYDPYGAFKNWNADDYDPCSWSHVECVFGHVQALDLRGLCLEGVLAPELGNLTHLRRLVLSQNHFSGVIPKEIGELKMLEELDLRDNNNLNENIPPEITRMQPFNFLLLYNDNPERKVSQRFESLNYPYKFQFDDNLTFSFANAIGFLKRKLGHSIWQVDFNPADFLLSPFTEAVINYLNPFQLFSKINMCVSEEIVQNVHIDCSVINRKLVEEPANPVSANSNSKSSGSLPGVRVDIVKVEDSTPPSSDNSGSTSNGDSSESQTKTSDMWLIMIGVSCVGFILFTIVAILFIVGNRGVKIKCLGRSRLKRQLQKAFINGVQKLNLTDLEAACEDFSNIIETMDGCTLFKGTLSSGVEICVAATTITRLKDWSKHAGLEFHNKIVTLSRVNHKNFVNLIGYCEEDEPFVRMMVFEYAPDGSLSEHLHVQEVEHLDWRSRMRIIMGIAYCLQYMHDLSPPVVHLNLDSSMIYLTNDYAAKVGDLSFWREFYPKAKTSGLNGSVHSTQPTLANKEMNVYSFGILLLEIISGKLPVSDKLESLITWAEQFLKDKQNTSHMIDPMLKSFEQHELEVVCEVIEECIQEDSRQRPTMNEVISKLTHVLGISQEHANPRRSPLWWAELELVSEDTT